jgi:DNA-binding response OmpR family regulator
MPALIVLMSADSRFRWMTDALLSEAGHLVAAVSSPDEAQQLLDSVTPDLLVADVRRGRSSALRLAVRSRAHRPALPVIVTGAGPHPAVEAIASSHGAQFLPESSGMAELLRSARAAIDRHRRVQPKVRRWVRRRVQRAVLVEAGDARARIVDMSHGGVRLVFENPSEVPERFDIRLPHTGRPVTAHCAWTARSTSDRVSCGAEIDEATRQDWRRFVDTWPPHADAP